MVSAWEAGSKPDAEKSVGELFADLSDELRRLARAEVQLAVTEAKRKAKRAGMGAAALGAAAVLALGALGVLLASATMALAHVVPDWLAAVLIGVGVLLVAGLSAMIGRSALRKALPPTPEWAVGSVREDIETIAKGARQ
jgi:hypothetical protein